MTASIPMDEADFGLALRYLDDELAEVERLRFEMRLSESASLAAAFHRVAALNDAQRCLQELESKGELPRPMAASWTASLTAAAVLLIVTGGLLSRSFLGSHPSNSAAPVQDVGAVGPEGSKGWTHRGVRRGGTPDQHPQGLYVVGEELGSVGPFTLTFQLMEESDVFLIGFPSPGPPARLGPGGGEPAAGGVRLAGGVIHRLATTPGSAGHPLALPATSTQMTVLLVARSKPLDGAFLAEVDVRLGAIGGRSESDLRTWLGGLEHTETQTFRIQRVGR